MITHHPAPSLAPTKASLAAARDRVSAHRQRCSRLPAVTAQESDALIAQFLARRGGVTRCPPAYAAPVR